MKRDCRDRLSSINKRTLIVFLEFDGLLDWNNCIIVILYSVCNSVHMWFWRSRLTDINDGDFPVLFRDYRNLANREIGYF